MKVTAVVEIPKGSTKKYEMDKVTGQLKVDRELPIPCPHYYGYIEDTLSEDGDPADIFIISNQNLKQGEKYQVELDGFFTCTDDGVEDNKYVGRIIDEQFDTSIDIGRSIEYIEIDYYLKNYKPSGNFKIEDTQNTFFKLTLESVKNRYSNNKRIEELNDKVNKLKSIIYQLVNNEDKSKLLQKLHSLD